MSLRRLVLVSTALAAAAVACRSTAAPSTSALAFEARPVPAERSLINPITIEAGTTPAAGGRSLVVHGGFFLGRPGYELEARLARTGPASSRLTVRAVPARRAGDIAAHYDYQAVVAVPSGAELTVVHEFDRADGTAAADTVFRGRPE
jgi:hypothetical protein